MRTHAVIPKPQIQSTSSASSPFETSVGFVVQLMSASVILATAGYGSIRLWQATSAQCRQSIQHADSQVNRLDITSDKQMLASAGNPMIRIFDIASVSQNQNPIRTLSGHKGNVTTIAFQKQARWMFSGSEDGMIKIWDIRTGGCQRSFMVGAPISDAILHPNQGEILTVNEAGLLRIYDLAAGKCSLSLAVDDRTCLRSISMASDASVVAAGNNKGKCLIWSVNAQHELELSHSINAHSAYLLKCLISPDNRYLATTSSDRSVRVWNLTDGIELGKTLLGHQGWVWDCTYSADSAYLVSASSDKTARLFDLGTGEVVLEYRGHAKAVTCVALNDSPAMH